MSFEIHSVMQHAHNEHGIIAGEVKNHMPLLPDTAQAGRKLFRAAAEQGIVEQRGEAGRKLIAIFARLSGTELAGRVACYFDKVGIGFAADTKFSHPGSWPVARHRPKCRRATVC